MGWCVGDQPSRHYRDQYKWMKDFSLWLAGEGVDLNHRPLGYEYHMVTQSVAAWLFSGYPSTENIFHCDRFD